MGKLHRDNAGYIGCSHEETQDPYYSYNKLSLPLSGATETVQRPAEVTHTVTVAGGKFVIGGVSQATLSLIEGGTYKFDQSDSSNGTHPFKFSQTSNGTWNRGTEYTKGVTYVGTPGSSGAYTQLVVPFGGLDLYYYCGNHTGMGGSASTPANAGMFTAGLPILKTTDQFGATLGSPSILFGYDNSDNSFDSSATSLTKDVTGYTFNAWSGSVLESSLGGSGANSAQVVKASDGSSVTWVVSTDSTDRKLWTSSNGTDWTSSGSNYDTDGSYVAITSVWLAWAGGANVSTTYVATSGELATDPYAANLVLAVPMNGSNGGTTFADKSAAIKGSGSAKAITVNGNTNTSTAQSIFYGSSAEFDGTDDNLKLPTSADFQFGSGDFTIETWFRPNNTSRMAIYHGSSGTDHSLGIDYSYITQTIGIWASSNGTSWDLADGDSAGNRGSIVVPVGAWTHVAFVRNGGSLQLYINGVLDKQFSTSASIVDESSYQPVIGEWFNSIYDLNGYLADFRIYKGVAKYQPEGSGSLGMDVVPYTGNGGTQTISGLKFQPDLLWIKSRSAAYSHRLYDSIRGVSDALYPDLTDAEGASQSINENLTGFTSDGFSLGAATGIDAINANNATFVAWAWKAGGAAVSNTDGTITSSVSANQTHGFSIISYTGNGTAGATVGHGLNATPSLVMYKNRDSSTNFEVQAFGTIRFDLNQTVANQGNNLTTFTNSTFSLASSSIARNASGSDYIAYCWSEVAGYSKFGSVSAGSDPIVTTGFKPRFVMVKRSDSAGNWNIFDTARGSGTTQIWLEANNSGAENNHVNGQFKFLDNGFQLIGPDIDVGTIIYMAFAESAPGDPGQDAFKIVDTLNTKDQSSSAHTVTNNGASFQTSVKKFYGGAAEFDGSSSFVRPEDSDDFKFGTGDFTVECWIYTKAHKNYIAYLDTRESGQVNSAGWVLASNAAGAIYIYSGTTLCSGLLTLNQWTHAAYVRENGVHTLYINGSPVQSNSTAKNYTDDKLTIGANSYASDEWHDGYMQDVRVYKGIAKYTSSFSPPERSVQGTARRYPSGVYVSS